MIAAARPAVGILPCGELSPRRTASRHQARLLPRPLAWALPGHGDALEGCGEPVLIGCLKTDGRGHAGRAWVQVRAHSCKRRECPRCYGSWAAWEGRKAARRTARGVAILDEGHAVHVVASPPQDFPFGTARDYRRLRAMAVRVLKGVGYYGGSLVFHPWRCTDGVEDGPHFHATATGWNEGVAEMYRATGWIVKAVRDDHGVRVLRTEDEIARVVVYALTHCGVGKDVETGKPLHALTWWGSFAVGKLKLPTEVRVEPEDVCPHCGAAMAPVVWLGGEPPPRQDGFVAPENVRADFGRFLEDVSQEIRRRARELVRSGRTDETGPPWTREVLY